MSMKLVSLRLRNFRGYTDTTVRFNDKLNVIIGKNDIGKSTILDALDIFLNSEQVKPDITDLNVNKKEECKIILNCTFKVDSINDIIIDSAYPTTLSSEYLLNKDGFLEIQKEWNCTKEKIGASDLKTYIIANYPQISQRPLVSEKIAELKNILQSIDTTIYNETDKTKSSLIRKAIYDLKINTLTEYKETIIDTSQVDAKDIWDSLQKYLPMYFLFKSDRENNDKDTEVQSPMKAVTKAVLANMRPRLDELCEIVRKEVELIGNDTIEKLKELDQDIARLLTPKVTTKPFDTIFSFDLISDDGIPLNKRGSGIRRLILLSYFRAEAEKKIKEGLNSSIIYAIEEPETSQHPDYQRMIIETLQELSMNEDYQIVITTHTPEIAKMVKLDQLIFIARDVFGLIVLEENNEKKYSSIATSLGILPYAVSQVVICVEGPNDVDFISNINENVTEFRNIISLKDIKIKIVPMTGSNLVRWVNENYFEESNIKEIHFYDNDREDYREIISTIQSNNDGRRFGWNTKRREMENYIPWELVEELFDIDLAAYKDQWSTIDIVSILCDKAKNVKIDQYKERKKYIKSCLNGKLTKKVTADMLRGIDAYDELETFFKNVKSILDGTFNADMYK